MEADSLTDEQAGALLQRYVAIYNAAVRSGDFSEMLDQFTDDAVLDFEGTPDWGPYTGKTEIARRYEEQPPDDEIRLTRWKYERGRIVGEFRWKDIPEARGGDIVIAPREGRVARLTVAFGGPATRWHA